MERKTQIRRKTSISFKTEEKTVMRGYNLSDLAEEGYSFYGVNLRRLACPTEKDRLMYKDTKFIYEGNFVSINLERERERFLEAPLRQDYYGVERFWGTLGDIDSAFCVHQSDVDHYNVRYPAERYVPGRVAG